MFEGVFAVDVEGCTNFSGITGVIKPEVDAIHYTRSEAKIQVE